MTLNWLNLRARLGLALIAAALALIGALALLWSAGTRNNEKLVAESSQAILENALADLRQRAELTLEHLADVLPNQVYYYDFAGLADTLAPVRERADVDYIQVFDLDGRLIHDGEPVLERFGERMTDPLAERVIAALGNGPETTVLWTDQRVDVSRTLMLGSVPLGGVRIGLSRAAADQAVAREQAALEAELRQRFEAWIGWLVAAFGLLFVGAGGAAWLVARGLVRPIQALAAAADRLEHGRFDAVEVPVERADELGKLVQAFNRMAVSLRDHDRDIRRLAYQDPLTGLPNRLMFRELLDQAVADKEAADGGGIGLLFIDLDGFKRINDTLGHDAGDGVLVEFAERLQRRIAAFVGEREAEHPIIARLGGDEFVALLTTKPSATRCEHLAGEILAALDAPFRIGTREVLLSASIGIARFPDDARSARQLLKCGDLAMYQAKLEGKNGVFFYRDQLTRTAEQNLDLEQALREALALGQVELRYQPVCELATGRITGAEALLRWPHAEFGDVPPERVVAVAESSALIEDLGRYVLRRACADAAAWQSQCPGLRVGVNISGRQLLRRGLAELVESALADSGLPAECLSLELTESTLLDNRNLTAETLLSLRRRGVNIWLDDFGTGFSGLSHLRQLQVSGVKIDRSFIADILTDPDDLALSSAIIAMAHSIGMRVIGEGVESREQFDLLRQRGCDLVQGFLVARPLPAAGIPAFRPDPALFADRVTEGVDGRDADRDE